MPLGGVKGKSGKPARSRAKVAQDPDMALAGRLRTAIGTRPVNEVARVAGISDPLLRAYLKGSKPGADKLSRLSVALGVNLDWLASGTGEMLAGTALRTGFGANEIVLVPVFEVAAASGAAAFEWRPGGEPVARVELPLETVRGQLKCPPEALVALPVLGRSMEPMYREGDVALIDRSRTEVPAGGGYFLVRMADGIRIKHVKVEGRHLVLSNINEAEFPAERLGVADALRLQVLGRIAGTQPDPRRARIDPPG